MRARRRFQRPGGDEDRTRVPTYLLALEVSVAVFDPSLRQAGHILREG